MRNDKISTGLGEFSKEKFNALVDVRAAALKGLHSALEDEGYTEVTVSSLVNIAGSCENPNASFEVNFYGRPAHLSQSAQLQLEAHVLRLRRGFFTVNNSFREENYDDPEAEGRRLSEFTLIEPEKPRNGSPDEALDSIIKELTRVIMGATSAVVAGNVSAVQCLGGDTLSLGKNVIMPEYSDREPFQIISYDDAIKFLNATKLAKGKKYSFGDDLGIREERAILRYVGNVPTFVTHYPAKIKFFNMKRTPDGEHVYSVDLLLPKLGEAVGGAVREEDWRVIEKQLRESRIADYFKEKFPDTPALQDPTIPFTEYFGALKQEQQILRGGYGIGFERFVAFLLGSNDILETIKYRTLKP